MVQEKNIVRLGLTIIMFTALLGLVSTPALAHRHGKHRWQPRACSTTASAAFFACQYEVKDDYWIAKGNCYNLSDKESKAECFEDAEAEYKEAQENCGDQLEARKELCEALGEDPYDPVMNLDDFVDFEEVVNGGSFTPNQYFPLVPGTTWVYKTKNNAGDVIERIKVEVLEETKEILGVNCIVVRDRVWEIDEEGEKSLAEDTFDWYAQDTAGNVWYFGEIAQEFEEGTLVSIDGSWTAGVDYAKQGIIMFFEPEEEIVYRQEFALGEAEDVAEVISLDETVTVRGTSYSNVRKTRDFTPIEPDVEEFKYYAPGVGVVLEENPHTGERVELVSGP